MSRKAVIRFIFPVLALVMISPRAAAQEKIMLDQVVAVVGSSAILYSEMDELAKQIVQQRREEGYTTDRNPHNEALEELLLQKMLYNQALIDSVEINTEYIAEAVEERVQAMVEQHGSVQKLEAFFHKPIFDIKRELATSYEEMSYARSMQSEVVDKVTITPGEVDRYFKSLDKDNLPIIPEQYIYAHITKFPSSTKEAKQRVRERLLEMRGRIIDGTRFDMLARMYSVDPGSAIRGGEMDPTRAESFVEPFAKALEKLQPGQISEVVETEYGFHLIQLIDKKGDLYHARHILLRPMFTDEELFEANIKLDSIVRLIKADSITFEKAAFDFSDDPYSKRNGGVVSNHDILEMYNAFDAKYTTTKFFKEDLDRIDVTILTRLKPGEISHAYQTYDMRGNAMSKIVKLIEVIPAHPANLKDDYLRLEEMALADKQEKEFLKWLDKKIEGMYVRIEPEYRSDEFVNKAWLK